MAKKKTTRVLPKYQNMETIFPVNSKNSHNPKRHLYVFSNGKTLDDRDSLKRLQGGGFIFFSRCPNNDKDVYFLLGRESITGSWKPSRARWAGFSGCVDAEEDMLTTCCREACEEILALPVVDHNTTFNGNQKRVWMDSDRMRADCLQGRFAYMVGCYTHPKRSRMAQTQLGNQSHLKVHFTIVKEIPWDPDISFKYAKLYSTFQKLNSVCTAFHTARQALETFERTWLPGINLGIEIRVCIQILDKALVSGIASTTGLPFLRVFPTSLRFKQTLRAFNKMNSWWSQLPDFEKTHPALQCVTSRDGALWDLSVDPHFMEKDRVAWWSVPLLRRVVKNNGILKGEKFRHIFLPTLKVIIDQMDGSTMEPRPRLSPALSETET